MLFKIECDSTLVKYIDIWKKIKEILGMEFHISLFIIKNT